MAQNISNIHPVSGSYEWLFPITSLVFIVAFFSYLVVSRKNPSLLLTHLLASFALQKPPLVA